MHCLQPLGILGSFTFGDLHAIKPKLSTQISQRPQGQAKVISTKVDPATAGHSSVRTFLFKKEGCTKAT